VDTTGGSRLSLDRLQQKEGLETSPLACRQSWCLRLVLHGHSFGL
jgi:hypothetical protein